MNMDDSIQSNAADERQVRKAAQRESRERQQEIADLVDLMNTAYGRRIVWRLFAMCGLYKSSFTGNSNTFMLEGRRSVALDLLADIDKYCPDQFILAMREHRKD